jgi:hypothetical protein
LPSVGVTRKHQAYTGFRCFVGLPRCVRE